MTRQVMFLLLSFIYICLPISVTAIEVSGLYQGIVTVNSRENTQERNRAFGDAMRQVLLKVTGNREVLSQAVIRRAISNADDYVDTWSYRTITPDDEAQAAIELSVSFFEPEVLDLLDLAGVPVWPQNRPYTLVWLVVQDELGGRELHGSSTADSEVSLLLEREAEIRALPLLLPVLDIDDRRAVSASDVWDMDVGNILQASSRYQSESILLMRVFRTLGGDVLARSLYLLRDQEFELEAFEEPLEDFIRNSVALATDELSSYYAILLSGTDSNIEVQLTVEGVSKADDYAELLNYVDELTDVNSYQVVTVDNDTIQLVLSTGGQIRQLVETIALNRNLLPSSEVLREDNHVFMSYRWSR